MNINNYNKGIASIIKWVKSKINIGSSVLNVKRKLLVMIFLIYY